MDEIFDFEELIFRILRKWRLILSFAVIFAVLVGGYRAYSGVKNMRAQSISVENSAKAEEAFILQRHSELAQAYMEESIMMKIDPYDVKTCKITFFVSSQDKTFDQLPENAIADLYTSLIDSRYLYESIINAANVEIAPDYLRELISVPAVSSNSFIIKVISHDSDLTVQIADAVANYFLSQQSRISQQAGDHSLQIFDKSSFSLIDLSTENYQNEVKNRVGRSIVAAKSALSVLPSVSMGSVAKSAVLYAIVGGILGLGVSVLLILFLDSVRMAVRSSKELRNKYGLRVLGIVSKEE